MRTLFSAVLLALLVSAASVAAQDSSEYRDAIKLGTAEFQAANYAEARAQFLRAHKVSPNARTLRALGMVAFELKNYGECIDYLAQALGSAQRPLDAEQRDETEQLLQRARGYVARLNVTVEPEAATVLLDGVPVQLDAGRTLVVQVGDHVLEFRAPGRLPEKRLVKIEGGEERKVDVVLPTPEAGGPRLAAAAPPPPVDAPSPEKPKRLYQKAWLWVVVGVVVVGAATGTALALTLNKKDSSKGDEPNLVAP